MTPEEFIPIYVLIAVGLLIVASVAYSRAKKSAQPLSRYQSRHQKYQPGQFSSQMELDLRLPYRRFRQLYPETRMTYDEYKRLQTQRAFRRSMSSQDNKRMVR